MAQTSTAPAPFLSSKRHQNRNSRLLKNWLYFKIFEFLLISCVFRRSSSKKEVNPAVMAEDAEAAMEAVEAAVDMAAAEEAAADSEVNCF